LGAEFRLSDLSQLDLPDAETRPLAIVAHSKAARRAFVRRPSFMLPTQIEFARRHAHFELRRARPAQFGALPAAADTPSVGIAP
jgi:hypothetical protein